ncbi:hypothetical protein QR680_015336 [Steinernema hermaphroditum]|uniref:F-box domain-containing protein n=1 Tax=Steinernema hermaphroditum TaxID=289476 RepID=A0AA39LK19_9BILA|nr:hypothetical protein QR680_015336 [Steinernema hermaphroditum]
MALFPPLPSPPFRIYSETSQDELIALRSVCVRWNRIIGDYYRLKLYHNLVFHTYWHGTTLGCVAALIRRHDRLCQVDIKYEGQKCDKIRQAVLEKIEIRKNEGYLIKSKIPEEFDDSESEEDDLNKLATKYSYYYFWAELSE